MARTTAALSNERIGDSSDDESSSATTSTVDKAVRKPNANGKARSASESSEQSSAGDSSDSESNDDNTKQAVASTQGVSTVAKTSTDPPRKRQKLRYFDNRSTA